MDVQQRHHGADERAQKRLRAQLASDLTGALLLPLWKAANTACISHAMQAMPTQWRKGKVD